MFKKRTIAIFSILSVFFLALLGQLVNVQVIDHDYYWKRSQDTITEVEMLRPLRGKILSRDGQVLARNKRQYNLFVIPGYVDDKSTLFGHLNSLTGASRNALSERYREIHDKIDRYAKRGETKRDKKRRRRSARKSPHRLMRYLTFDEASRIQTERGKFKGTHVRSRPSRMYPEGKTAGHLTGYVAKLSRRRTIEGMTEYEWMKMHHYHRYLGEHLNDNQLQRLEWRGSFLQGYIGRAGLEDEFDTYLRGKPGLQLIERDLLSGTSDQHRHIPPVNGKDLRLTIDAEWQNTAQNIIRDISGAMVVMDPTSYEIRAMASSPEFDPNRLVSPVSSEAVSDILQNSSRPLLNRAIAGQYPPGSAFKILVSIAGVETGAISPSTSYRCSGQFKFGNNVWNCWIYERTQSGHGLMNMSEALQHSCNIFFYKAGRKIGASQLKKWSKRLGFSQKTGIELPGEASGSLFKNRGIINASIGQGRLMVTPIQLARLTAFAATGNPFKTPTIVKQPDRSRESEKIDVRTGTLESIRKGMYDVVNKERGTAYRAESLRSDDLPYDVAGKTSTAQVGGNQKPHAWFVGFAPFDNPRIAFAIIYEHGESGGGEAAPLVGKFLNRIDLMKKDRTRSDGSASDD